MTRKFPIRAFSPLFLLPISSLAHAADFTWTGASPFSGGNNNMSNPANWSGPNAPPNNGGTADLVFSGITRTSPNADVNYTINTLRFTSTQGFTVGGNPITLQTDAAVAPFIRNEAGALNRINNSLTFSNSGTISAQNGNLTIGGVLGTGLIPGNTVTLNANSGRALNFTTTVAGFGSLLKTGAGTVRFNALVGTTGPISMDGGIMELSGQIAGTSAFNFNAGTVRLLADNRIPSLPFHMPSGTILDLDGFSEEIGTLSGSGTITLGSGGILSVNQSADTIFAGSISGTDSAGFTKRGAERLTLTQAGGMTYGGPTLIENGTLRAGATSVFSTSSPVTVEADALLALNGFNQTIGGLAGSGTVNMASARLTIGQSSETEFSGTINGTINSTLVKNGSGILRLTGANTYSGLTTINNGRLVITNSGSLGTATNGTVVNPGGTLEVTSTLTLPGGETISLAGDGIGGVGALAVRALTAGVNATIQGDVQLASDALINNISGGASIANIILGSTSPAGTLALGSHDLAFGGNSMGDVEIRHQITGTGSLIYRSGGNLILRGNNTAHTGPIEIQSGGLQIGTLNSIGQTGGLISFFGSRLAVNSSSFQTDRNLLLGGELTTASESASWHGAGSITINLANLIRASQITLPSGGPFSPSHITLSGTGPIIGNAPLRVEATAGSSVTIVRPIELDAANGLIKTGPGTFHLNHPVAISGATEIRGGVLAPGAANVLSADSEVIISAGEPQLDLDGFDQTIGGLSGAGSILGEGAKLAIRPKQDRIHSGNISGPLSMIIEGNGSATQSFSGTKGYFGPTTIRSGGILRVLTNEGVPNTGLIVESGGRFIAESPEIRVSSLQGGGTIEFAPLEESVSILAIGILAETNPTTFSGTITGPGTFASSQEMTLSNATLNHTGETFIRFRTLTFGADTTLQNSPITIGETGRLHASGTVSSIVLSGTLNPGIGALAGDPLVANQTIIEPGATFEWKVTDWEATPGVGADLLQSTNVIFNATPAARLRVRLEIPSTLANFDNSPRVFKLITSSNFSGAFTPDAVAVDYLDNGAGLNGNWATRITGNDLELVFTPGDGDTYETWIAGFNVGGLDAPNDDPDKDGIPNLIEFIIGGNPQDGDDSGKLPTSIVDSTHIEFTFRRSAASAYLNPAVRHGTDLVSWDTAIHNEDGVTISSASDPHDPDIDLVTVRIPRDSVPRRFAQLFAILPAGP